MMRRLAKLAAAALIAAAGCGETGETLEAVPLDKLPAGSIEAAKKAVPGVTFERARKAKVNGQDAFELVGKDKRGKTREVEVSPEGKVLEVQ
jgi:hypothetical protein